MNRKPRALCAGSTVAVVAPSGPVAKESLDRGVGILESLGLKVRVLGSVLKQYGYLAGEDRDRARDFTTAWTDPAVDGVVCARGGYGATRMLRYLDFNTLKPHKKVFVGYSDITALHLALRKRLRLVTFHGPMLATRQGASLDVPYNLDGLWSALSGGDVKLPEKGRLHSLSPGLAEGELVGGNLSLVAASIGTAYEVNTKGKILFLEEVGEAPYRIDRMLCQLDSSGKLDQAAGFLVGDFTDCEAREGSPTLAVEELIRQYLGSRGKPCLSGVPAGHAHLNLTLPLGIRVAVDGDNGTMEYLESPVSSRQ
ncbi:MAG: S66 peptidase family protein [Bacillota bacterium]